MATRASIQKFLHAEAIAVFGVSRNGKKFGNYAFKQLRKKGYRLYPVHPEAERLEGGPCYSEIGKIPEPVQAALIVLPSDQTEKVLAEVAAAGIRNVWIQQGAESEEALRICREEGLDAIHGECILMFAQPSGFHKFHHWLWKALGKLPKQ